MQPRLKQGRAGFTLIEVAISVSILGLLMAIFGMVSSTSTSAYRAVSIVSGLDVNARRTLTRVGSELASIGGSTLNLDPEGNFGLPSLQYQRAIGFNTGVNPVEIDWGEDTQLGFEYEVGEVDDGLDNDGDGLVDEGVVVLTLGIGGPNPRRVILCHDVRELALGELPNGVDDNGNGVADEAGFNMQRVGDVMTVRLCLERRAAGGGTVVRTHQTSVRLRNIDQ